LPPFLQHHLHREKLPIPHIVVPLHGIEAVGEEGAGMQLKVQGRTLGQDSPHSDIRSIGLHHELMGRVRMNQDRSSVEAVVKGSKRPVSPVSGAGVLGESGRR
jgi:hypothetical protein